MIGVGDLVVCVDVEPRADWAVYCGDAQYTRALEMGKIYEVRRCCIDPANGHLAIDVGVPSPNPRVGAAWPADRFRKIQHDKREACEGEFVTLLNRVKQGERA